MESPAFWEVDLESDGWTAAAALSPRPLADSEALSRVDFWLSGVAFSLACSPKPLRRESGGEDVNDGKE